MSNNHLIHQLILDLNFNSETQDLGRINDEVNQYKNEILAVITEYFNSLRTTEEILINHLKIDIGKFSTIEELRNKITQQLDAQLHEILKGANTKTPINSEFLNQFLNVNTSDNNPLNIILHFLKTGTYLWDFQKIDFKNKNRVDEYSKVIQQYIEQNAVEDLLRTIINSPSYFWRLHFYFPKLTFKIIEKIISQEDKNQELIEKIWKDLILIFSKTHALYSKESWRQFFQIVLANHQSKIDSNIYFNILILLIIKKDITLLDEIVLRENQLENQFLISSDDRKSIAKYLSKVNNSIDISEKQSNLEAEISTILKDISVENTSIIEENYLENSDETIQKHFPNCGIIFLHAYLNQFFEEQGILINKKFKNRRCKIKAIQLMLYLATSKLDFNEDSELSFFKILVDIPTDDFITFPKPLIKKEKAECDIVLQSLIEHWSVLKKTSIETLQYQFIQRNGLLSKEEKSIEIHLEKSGVDILLEHFPFNYSIIKLVWLKKILIIVL